jgi:ABC-type multidrug transport system ATPase subunit
LNEPSLLLLDEPTVGLDVEGRRDFYKTLNNIIKSNNITVLWTSHYLEEIERNCQRVIIIDKGRKIADDSIELLINKPNDQSIVIKFSDTKSKGEIDEILRKFSFTHHPNGEYVFMGNENTFYSEILPELITHGANPASVVSKSPSLEDLFLNLVSTYNKKTIIKDKGT